MESVKNFWTRDNFYHLFIFSIFCIVCLYDINLTVALILSFSISCFTEPLTRKLNEGYKIPLFVIILFYVSIILSFVFLISKLIISSILNQNNKIISLINDKIFISNKIKLLRGFIEHVSEKFLFLQDGDNSLYSDKIDELFLKLPDVIINKSVMYIRPIVEKSYITGLKLLNFYFVIILSVVFTCYMIVDLDKIKKIPKIVFGRYTNRVFYYLKNIKDIVITIWINQIKVACILLLLYSGALYFFEFDYFFIYALCFSFFTMIPFLGGVMSISLLIISCYLFDYSFSYSLKLFGVLMAGFSLENFFLTPKLVGQSINSHPLSIFIGLIILPQLFGALGLIFTLPIVAILNSILYFVIEEKRDNLN